MNYIIIFILSFFSFACSASVINRELDVSIFELLFKPKSFHNKKIALSGYLEEKEGVYYLCFSNEVCILDGKEKVIISFGKDVNNLESLNGCLINAKGLYKSVEGGLNFVGYLYVKSDNISIPSENEFKRCYNKIVK